MRTLRLLLPLCVMATLLLYAVMSFWALPRLMSAAGGMPPFDVRVTGYSMQEAQAYLQALSDPGRQFYLGVVGWLDTIFPPLLALSLTLSFWRLAPRWAALPLSVLAIAAAVFDWLENAAIAVLLRADPATLSAADVAEASRWSLLKWGADGVTLVAFAGFLIAALVRWRQRRTPARGFTTGASGS